MDLKGKTAIITGAAGGIGKATAYRLSEAGAAVAVLDINETGVRETADGIIKAGGKAISAGVDIRDSKAVKEAVAETIRHFGAVDILVNNAGGPAAWHGKGSLFLDSAEETWKFVLDINLLGTMIVTHAVLGDMTARRKGKIINIGSVAGVNGLSGMVDYSAAKGGVIAMTRALAIELGGYSINVNCISPGSIDSRGSSGNPPTFLKRTGKPEEVASLILFLSSAESDFITGQNYIIDGGRVLSTTCR